MEVVRFSSDTFLLLLLLILLLLQLLWLSTNAVQLTVPIGDDGQRCPSPSCLWPVLWLSTNAVQLAVPIGDDGQLMSFSLLPLARPMTKYKYTSFFSSPAARSSPFLFYIPLFSSSYFSVPILFLFSVLLLLDGGVFRSIGNFR